MKSAGVLPLMGGGGKMTTIFLTIWPTSGCHGQIVKNF